MEVFEELERVQPPEGAAATAVTIGVFDGVHLGHQELIGRCVRAAAMAGLAPMAITFANHPLSVLAPPYAPPLLLPLARKHALMSALGLRGCASLRFTPELAAMPAPDFIERVLVQGCRARHVVIGYDFTFGRGGEGNAALLQAQAAGRYCTEVCDPVASGHTRVKSTTIRNLLLNGDVAEAAALLGRPFELTGRVVAGAARGRTIGFPTANLQPVATGLVVPAGGVYAVDVRLPGEPGRLVRGMMNIGTNPTFTAGQGPLSIEVHLLDFSGDLLGQELDVFFVARLRSEQRFSGVDALVEQLHADRAAAAGAAVAH